MNYECEVDDFNAKSNFAKREQSSVCVCLCVCLNVVLKQLDVLFSLWNSIDANLPVGA